MKPFQEAIRVRGEKMAAWGGPDHDAVVVARRLDGARAAEFVRLVARALEG